MTMSIIAGGLGVIPHYWNPAFIVGGRTRPAPSANFRKLLVAVSVAVFLAQ